MTHAYRKPGWLQRLARRLFSAPFQQLPPEFGNTVPPELGAFKAQAEGLHYHARATASPLPAVHHAQTRPARLDESLERQ